MTRTSKELSSRWRIGPDHEVLETPIGSIRKGPLQSRITMKRKDFYFFDFPDWVNIIARTPDNKILLIRQFRYGTKRMELEIPGGMIDPGEDPVGAGCRELLEETGFAGQSAKIIGKVCPNPAIQGNSCYTVLVEHAVLTANQSPDDMEEIDCLRVPAQDIDRYIRDGLIEHGLVLNAFFHYDRYNNGRAA
ncbi:MAG: NUDIX hydrolase [Desulfofustis sp.]|nr:NUDIX hydrolase [Desulfofustis sp.]NNF45401.1 NUDIX hydrolase [Desulfofustis sp.]RZW27271.1 MAG: NUDIX hydrolase [Desulfobulbaceae bacterium]